MLHRVMINFVGLESQRVLQALNALQIDTVISYDVSRDAPYCVDDAGFISTHEEEKPQSLIAKTLDAGCDGLYLEGISEVESFAASSVCSNLRIGYLLGPPDHLATLMNRVGIRWAASDLKMAVVTTSEKIESVEDGEYWLIRLGLPLVLRTLRAPSIKIFTEEEAKKEIEKALEGGAVVLERLLPDVREVETLMFSDGENLPICLGESDCSIRVDGYRSFCEFPPQGISNQELLKLRKQAAQLIIGTQWKGFISARFLVTEDGRAYFLQLNPGLKPWHTAVEASLEVDLYEAHFRVLNGDELGWEQSDIVFQGHTLCLLVYATSSGRISTLSVPKHPSWNWGPSQGDYTKEGELIGTFAVKAADRFEALCMAKESIEELSVGGIETNIEGLEKILCRKEFWSGPVTRDIPTD